MDVSLAGNKRKKTKVEKPYVSIDFDILKPGGNKYSEIDYQELKRQNAIVDEATLDGDLHNVGPVDFLRRLEAKYSNKGKKYRFEEDDIANRNYDGYEDEDGFIDDSEAFEEQLPSTMETLKGGFYVNKGSLELKELNESQFAVDEDEEDDEESVVEDEKKKEEKKKVVEPVRMVGAPPTMSRMVGGPPTMKRTFSEADRIANDAKRKKTIVPITVPSVMKKVSPPDVQKAKSSDSVIVLDDEPTSVKQKSPQVASSSSAPTSIPAATPSSSSSQKVTTPVKPASSNAETIMKNQKMMEFLAIVEKFPLNNSLRKSVIQQLSAEFFNSAVGYFLGGKKRLDDATIDAIIKIEDFYKNEHVVKSQRVAVQESIASFLSIHRSTVITKTQQRRAELEARAKNDKDDDIQVIPTPSSSTPSPLPINIKEIRMGQVKHWNQIDVNNINMAINSLRKNTPNFNDLAILYAIQEANTHNLSVGSASQKLLNFRPTPDMIASLASSLNNATSTTTSKPMRKSRVYLNVWVKESTEYFNMMLKQQQKPSPNGKLTEEQNNVIKSLKAASEKSKEMHRKAVADAVKNNGSAPNLTFTFTDVLIGALHQFIETIYAYTLMQKTPNLPVSALSSCHKVVADDICEAMFFIEVARRLPKIAYVLDLPEVKKMLTESKLFVDKYQVVQNSKYMLKWPEGTEPKKDSPNGPPKPVNVLSTKPTTTTTSPAKLSTLSRPIPSTSKSAVSINQQPSTSTASSSKSTTPQKLLAPVAAAAAAQPVNDKMKALTDQLMMAQFLAKLQQNPTSAAVLLASLRSQYGDGPVKLLEDRLRIHLEEQERQKKEELERQRKAREALEARKKLEEAEKQRKIRELMEARKKQEEAERQRKAEEAERQRKLAEEKRKAKVEEKMRKEKEAREKREREAREARERKEREERERREAQEALHRLAEEQRRQREAEEKARMEEERRIRLEKEKLENEKAAERARELERMRSRQREEEKESKPMVQKVQQQTSNYLDNSRYVNDLPPVRIKKEINESVVTMNPQTSYSTPNTSMNFNQSFQNGNSMQSQQIPASPSSSSYGSSTGGQQMMGQQTSMMGQSPQQYMMSPSNSVQQYSQNMIQQNLMFVQQQQQQQQQMMRQQQVQAQTNHQQQQYTNWNNMMEQQQRQEFAAQLQHEQQRQLQLQMQQQQQQQQHYQQNFQNYGNGYNNSR